ncbi:condensation domain-containing protein [Actinosynnema sp. NPDC023794]
MRTRIDVEFVGDRDGTAAFTWGQRGIWDAMATNRQTWNLSYVVELADVRADVDSVVDAIGRLLVRHESLRTVVRVAEGSPLQVVVRSGSLPVLTVTSGAAEARDTAMTLRRELVEPPFDHGTELPVRINLVEVDGVVWHAVFVYSHVAVDFGAAQVIHEDLRHVLATGSFPGEAGLQPLDLARREASAGAAVTSRAVRYWTEQLRRIPPTTLSSSGPLHDPPVQEGVLMSTALRAAAKRVAARHGTTASTAVLAACAMILGRWTGHSVVALNMPVGNRFKEEHRRLTTNLVQHGLFVLDLPPGGTLDDIVPLAVKSAMRAYRYAYYDQTALDRARAEIDAERGEQINPLCCFQNLDNVFDEPDALDGLPDGDIAEKLVDSQFAWGVEDAPSRCHFCLKVGPWRGEDQAVRLTANTAYLPPDRIGGFLRELEGVLVSSAVPPRS